MLQPAHVTVRSVHHLGQRRICEHGKQQMHLVAQGQGVHHKVLLSRRHLHRPRGNIWHASVTACMGHLCSMCGTHLLLQRHHWHMRQAIKSDFKSET